MSQVPPLPSGKPSESPSSEPLDQSSGNLPEGQNSGNYSLDEIMKTLRDGERKKDEDGEVVTRDDGSLARKVRKRRRRSEQKEKAAPEKERNSLVLRASMLLGFFLFLLMVAIFIVARFNSGSYAEQLEAKAKEWTGAEVNIHGPRITPGSVSATRAEFDWGNDSFLDQLTLRLISGDMRTSSFVGTKLGGQQVGGRKGTLELQTPEEEWGSAKSIGPDEFPFDFQRYYCDSLDVSFGKGSSTTIRKAETSLRYLNGEGYRLTVGGGELSLAGWNRFPIENALLMFPAGEINLVSLRLQGLQSENQLTSSVMVLSGKIPLEEGAKAQLKIVSSGFPFEGILGNSLGPMFPGMIRSIEEGVVSLELGQQQLSSVVVPFKGNYVELKRFAFLSDLEELFGDDGKGSFYFDSAISGTYQWTPEAAGIKDFKVANKNFRVDGNVIASKHGQLRGQLRLWISLGFINGDPVLKVHPGFNNRLNGYAYIDVTLGGTVASPLDDFKQVTGLTDSLPGGGNDKRPGFEDIFNDITSSAPSPEPEGGE